MILEQPIRTPISTIAPFDLSTRLEAMVKQAYFRRSRQLPANIGDMVECLKGDLLRHMRDVPIETVDLAITTSTLHDTDTPLSEAFFFAAVKKAWWHPKTNPHNWDNDDPDRRPDTEVDQLALLDWCAAYLKADDARQADSGDHPLKGCVALPAFNPNLEFAYLATRGQLDDSAADRFATEALVAVNTERMATSHHRLTKEEAKTDPDVKATAKRLAVLDWLRACNIQGRKPSETITPNETEYSLFRRHNP